jgi:hypothetical protein
MSRSVGIVSIQDWRRAAFGFRRAHQSAPTICFLRMLRIVHQIVSAATGTKAAPIRSQRRSVRNLAHLTEISVDFPCAHGLGLHSVAGWS